MMNEELKHPFNSRIQVATTSTMNEELKEASIYYNKPVAFLVREAIELLLGEYNILKQLGETE